MEVQKWPITNNLITESAPDHQTGAARSAPRDHSGHERSVVQARVLTHAFMVANSARLGQRADPPALTPLAPAPYLRPLAMVERSGNCRVVGEIGSGGMAVVYKAVQEPLGRTVAIKALKPSIAMDSQFAKRFEREAHFMASLQHENILHVIDFVKDGRSMYFIMEYVQGIDLYDLLEHSERLPPEVAAIIALQVCRAHDYAHSRGIIHRDNKPANIMISRQGEVKLMDFGIARD